LVVPEELALARLRLRPQPMVTPFAAAPCGYGSPSRKSECLQRTPLSWSRFSGAFRDSGLRSDMRGLLKHDPRHRGAVLQPRAAMPVEPDMNNNPGAMKSC